MKTKQFAYYIAISCNFTYVIENWGNNVIIQWEIVHLGPVSANQLLLSFHFSQTEMRDHQARLRITYFQHVEFPSR